MGEKIYLGDAVYAQWSDGGMLTLTTEDGYKATNTIHLEPEVLEALTLWLGMEKRGARRATHKDRTWPGRRFVWTAQDLEVIT